MEILGSSGTAMGFLDELECAFGHRRRPDALVRGDAGLDLSVITQARPDAVGRELNGRPRETFGYETPAERFQQAVASTG